MGRIRTTLIKRTAHKLIEKHGSEFTNDFSNNKKMLDKLISTPSKVLKNKIAGYITQIIKKRDLPED